LYVRPLKRISQCGYSRWRSRQNSVYHTTWNISLEKNAIRVFTAPGTFQRLMDLVMCGLSYESVLVYLDDLIIMASSFEQLVDRFAVVLRLLVSNLKLNCRKCNLFQRKVSFLEHIVSEAGVEVQPEKTEVVSNWPVLLNLSELRSFLGLSSYYCRFINSFSIVAAPFFC